MSLILEALKKSEAERQRGQAPGLFVEQAPLARPRREGTPAWAWALGGVLLVVLAVFGWREWSRLPATPVEAPAPQPAPESGRGSEPAALPPLAPGEGRGEGTRASEPAPAPAATPAPPPAPASEPMRATTRPEPPRAPSPQPSPASGRGSDSPAAVAAPAAEAALPRLADLPAGERAALPPLKLTMHVFADDPSARFVILDGRRLGEGAMLGDAVLLREIRRDGVVLEAGGRVLLLPRP